MPTGKWVKEVGRSKGQPVIDWIGDYPRPERVQTSDRCFVARKFAKLLKGGKANGDGL